jgi:Ca2+-binding RTX toxin-like protein
MARLFFNRFFKTRRSWARKAATRSKARPLSCEMLEGRRLLAVNYDTGTFVVSIVGSSNPDTYTVTPAMVAGANVIRITENGMNFDYPVVGSPIASIMADLSGDNDTFTMTPTLNIPARVRGGTGNDQISTAAGNDFVNGGSGNDLISLGDGNDSGIGGLGDDGIRGGLGNDSLRGSTGNDKLLGEDGVDNLDGGIGNDLLFGGNGGDVILAGSGEDTVWAGAGMDYVEGGTGKDSIYGESDNDVLYGNEDDDFISGGNDSDDDIFGGKGDDELHGDEGNDDVYGEEGNDLVFGETGDDLLDGGKDNDSIFGGEGNDLLDGDEGDDILDGQQDRDVFDGGDGFDTADYSSRVANLLIELDNVNDDGQMNEHDNVLTTIERVLGGMGNDLIVGNDWANTLEGNDGFDTLVGEGDNDTLLGGAGTDLLVGAAGDDILRGGNDNDNLFGDDGEDDLDGEDGADFLSGGSDDDTLRGGADSDTLNGDDGNDRLLGGSDDDFLFGGNGVDGLYGSTGTDELTGGADSDRFLDSYTGALIHTWSDNHVDKDSDDVRVAFNDGQQSESILDDVFAAGSWTESDVEAIDKGLQVLHEATGNKSLLEREPNGILNGDLVTITRQSSAIVDGNGDGPSALAWNSGQGDIFVADGTFSDSRSPTEVIIHEIGHNWDTEYDEAGWGALSGWVESDVSPGANFTQGSDTSGTWWFATALEGFVSSYAQTNLYEDFAESFTSFYMTLAGLTFVGDGGGVSLSQLPGKTAFMEDMLIDLT